MSQPRILLLTGRSDPARTGLPPSQRAFLAAVTPPGAIAVPDGFPWIGGLPEAPVALPLAAWRNAVQWRRARMGTDRAAIAARLHGQKGGPLAIITASCGLDMLQSGWQEPICSLVIALGPVTARRPVWPGVRLVTIVGRADYLSRALHRVPPDIRVRAAHMGYWTCPETRAAAACVLQGWTA